jgi:hypothetical protein
MFTRRIHKIGLMTAIVMGLNGVSVASDLPPEDQIQIRQAGYTFMAGGACERKLG